jgi:NADH-quinone oxidoreductase subunit M
MILAGVLLKLGSYGIFRFMLPVFTYANEQCAPFVYVFCSASALYISALASRQIDIKKIIAYSSIAHMCFVLIGLFTFTKEGIAGSIFLMIAHGLVSAGLFACVGILYTRYKTRLVIYYSNVSKIMPLFTRVFFFFIMANAAFPLSPGFVAEAFIAISIAKMNLLAALMMLFTIIYTAVYCFFLYNKISNTENSFLDSCISGHNDLTRQEAVSCIILLLFSFILGVSPGIIMDKIELICQFIVVRNYH